MSKKEYFTCKQPILPKREGIVRFPVSYTYNGGIIVNDKWYKGYDVPSPLIPEGYELVSMAMALQLNAHPPYATMYLKKVEK